MNDRNTRAGQDADIVRAAKWLAAADAVVITAGAGMGVDSNLPDFRGDEGFWRAYPLYKELGFNFAQMADPQHFEQNPALAWGFYGHRLNLYRATTPHAGFTLLKDRLTRSDHKRSDHKRSADTAEPLPHFVVTSNVDGQFQKAGFAEKQIWEIHGSIHRLQCLKPCSENIFLNSLPDIEVDMTSMTAKSWPSCPDCSARSSEETPLRPNILMFGDYAFNDAGSYSQQLGWNRFLAEHREKNLVIIEMGAGTAIPSIRRLGEHTVKNSAAAKLIRINPREAQVPRVLADRAIGLAMGAKDGVQRLLTEL